MKRIITLSILMSLLCTTTIFAVEGKYGVDFSLGVGIGFQNQEGHIIEPNQKLTRTDFFLPLKVSTYDYFLLDDMLGIYGSISLSPLGTLGGEKIDDDKAGYAMLGINELAASFELIIGPAFGINLGDSNLRFQTGAGFHLLVATTTTEIILAPNCPELFTAMGIGLTPQLRFNSDSDISLILGCDLVFDFAFSTTRTVCNINRDLVLCPDISIDKFFRFGITPHFGVGINF